MFRFWGRKEWGRGLTQSIWQERAWRPPQQPSWHWFSYSAVLRRSAYGEKRIQGGTHLAFFGFFPTVSFSDSLLRSSAAFLAPVFLLGRPPNVSIRREQGGLVRTFLSSVSPPFSLPFRCFPIHHRHRQQPSWCCFSCLAVHPNVSVRGEKDSGGEYAPCLFCWRFAGGFVRIRGAAFPNLRGCWCSILGLAFGGHRVGVVWCEKQAVWWMGSKRCGGGKQEADVAADGPSIPD